MLVSRVNGKKGKDGGFATLYGRFLSTMIVIAKPMAIAIIIAITPAMMYISKGGRVVTGFGDGVGAAGSTTKDVIARDGQYDSEPAKEA